MDLIKFTSTEGEVVLSKSFVSAIKEKRDYLALLNDSEPRKLIEITTKNIDDHKKYYTIVVESTVQEFTDKYFPELNSSH